MIITSAVDISIHAVSPVSISPFDLRRHWDPAAVRAWSEDRERSALTSAPRQDREGVGSVPRARPVAPFVAARGSLAAQVAIVGPHQTDAAMIT